MAAGNERFCDACKPERDGVLCEEIEGGKARLVTIDGGHPTRVIGGRQTCAAFQRQHTIPPKVEYAKGSRQSAEGLA